MVFKTNEKKTETEKLFESEEKRAKELSNAKRELKIAEEEAEIAKLKDKANKLRPPGRVMGKLSKLGDGLAKIGAAQANQNKTNGSTVPPSITKTILGAPPTDEERKRTRKLLGLDF